MPIILKSAITQSVSVAAFIPLYAFLILTNIAIGEFGCLSTLITTMLSGMDLTKSSVVAVIDSERPIFGRYCSV